MTDQDALIPLTTGGRLLTAAEFQRLADVPPEIEWFANITNKSTRRAYENALQDFMGFIGISQPGEFREVTGSRRSPLSPPQGPVISRRSSVRRPPGRRIGAPHDRLR